MADGVIWYIITIATLFPLLPLSIKDVKKKTVLTFLISPTATDVHVRQFLSAKWKRKSAANFWKRSFFPYKGTNEQGVLSGIAPLLFFLP